jgi:hypothetical protein
MTSEGERRRAEKPGRRGVLRQRLLGMRPGGRARLPHPGRSPAWASAARGAQRRVFPQFPHHGTRDDAGCGGRNQEFVLAAAGRIAGRAHIAIASVDSEGTDGPTEAAGGIVDGETLARAQAASLDIGAELANHNSSAVLGGLDDLIVTGVRGTNVRDLRLIYVGAGR